MSGATGGKGGKAPATNGDAAQAAGGAGNGAGAADGAGAAPGGQPDDVRKVVDVLKTMGVTSYEPRVLNQIMELVHMFVSDVLTDARVMAHHRRPQDAAENRPSTLILDDVKLALKMKSNRAFLKAPTGDLLSRLSTLHARPESFPDHPSVETPLPQNVEHTLMALNHHLEYFDSSAAAAAAGGSGAAGAGAAGGGGGGLKRARDDNDDGNRGPTKGPNVKQGNFNTKVADKPIGIKFSGDK